MKRAVLFGSAAAVLLGAAPLLAVADDGLPANAPVQLAQEQNAAGEVDAGSLIGQEVVDVNGDKVGDIDSVMVDQSGKVSSVVVDVSGWLESEKLIALNWSDLQVGEDNKIVTSMTKETAEAAEAYAYQDEALRGQVMTESGEPYAASDAPAEDAPAEDAQDTATAETTDTDAGAAATGAAAGAATGAAATADATADADAPVDEAGGAVVNADGSLNASKLIGLDVESAEDEKVGDIGEVVLDKGGQVQGVVVDVGGFLGLGSRPVLLDWKDVNLASQDGQDRAVINLSKEKLEQMPAYESSKQ